jgi:hypothetical protein
MFDIEDQIKLAELVNSVGEPVGTLENDGWVIQSVEPVHSLSEEIEKELKGKKFDFEIINQPNQPSAEDTTNRRVRYKYVVAPGKGAPIIDTSRTFCKDMLRTNRVFYFNCYKKIAGSSQILNPSLNVFINSTS